MPINDPIPAADHQEQDLPPVSDPHQARVHPDDLPEADVLEQEQPVVDTDTAPPIDAERAADVDDSDWSEQREER